MYAIFEDGGKQYKVSEGDVVDVDLKDVEENQAISFDKVKLIGADDGVKVGAPDVEGAKVDACVVGDVKGKKVEGISFRRRQGSKVKSGHRQQFTRVKITGISA